MTAIAPGSTIGILGGGQLALMTAVEARRMGYGVAVLDPDPAAPAARVADRFICAPLADPAAADRLASGTAVVTVDTEHVPVATLRRLEDQLPVRPGTAVMSVIQDRRRQREFLASIDAPQPSHAFVSSDGDLAHALAYTGFPAVLKTRRSGYDGKGQARIARPGDEHAAWDAIGAQPAVVESFVPFACEISVVLGRFLDGGIAFYPVAENVHRRHVLHTTRVPAAVPALVARTAMEIAARIAAALGVVGVMAVEFFVTADNQVLVNEVAPRTHNSGHFTLGACVTSQFAQHVRAICGLPAGDAKLLCPAVTLNLLGDIWASGAPAWEPVLQLPHAQLHLYGKARATEGRKMGHVLLLGEDTQAALDLAGRLPAEIAAAVSRAPGRAGG